MTVDAIRAISKQFPVTSAWNGYHQNLCLKILGGLLVETLKIQKFEVPQNTIFKFGGNSLNSSVSI